MNTNIDARTGKPKIIIDACGGTGSWSKPYVEAGYNVRLVTLPKYDVLTYIPPKNVYGILAAPPCTDFSVSGSQYWGRKDQDGTTINSMGVLIAVLKIISLSNPKFWALENPVGRIRRWLGDPQLKFNPCDYGDPYTKKTYLWGVFNGLEKNYVEPSKSYGNQIHYPKDENGKAVSWNSAKCKEIRSITPPGFAKAFHEANK